MMSAAAIEACTVLWVASSPGDDTVRRGANCRAAPTPTAGRSSVPTICRRESIADAIVALQKALDSGFPPQIGKYNLACAYARTGDKQKALDLLEAVAAGPGLPGSDCERSRSSEPARRAALSETGGSGAARG